MCAHHCTPVGVGLASWHSSGSIIGLSTLSPVSTGMGDHVWVRLPEVALYFGM